METDNTEISCPLIQRRRKVDPQILSRQNQLIPEAG